MSSEDHDLLVRIDGRVERLEKHLLGNGQPGVVPLQDKRITVLEEWKSTVMGALKFGAWCIGVTITVTGVIFAAVQVIK